MPYKKHFFNFNRSIRSFSTSTTKKSSVWPCTFIAIPVLARYLAVNVVFLTSLAVMGIFLSHAPTQGLETEFFETLNIFLRNMNDVSFTMVNRLTRPYTQLDLQAFLDILRGIILLLQQILELANHVLEDIDAMSDFYDIAFNQTIQVETIISRLLFIYRRIEAELGISVQETDLVPDPSEEEFYAAYVLALTGQGA